MISDTLISPGLFALYVLTNGVLHKLGINNSIVLLSFLFVFVHLFLTILMKIQTGNKLSRAAFSSVFSAIVAIVSYALLLVFPVIKVIFYPFSLLPGSELWLTHFIVAIPVTLTHIMGRYAIQ